MRYGLAALSLVAACSHAERKEPSPPIAADAPAAAARAAAAADPEAGPPLTADEQVDHVLARVTFGARPGDRERVARIGIPAFLEEQLHPESVDDRRMEQELTRFPVLSRDTSELAQELTEFRARRQQEKRAKAATEDSTMAAGTPPRPGEEVGRSTDDEHIAALAEERRLAASQESAGARESGAMADVEQDGPELPRAKVAPQVANKDLRRQLGRAGRGPGFDFVAQLSQAKLLRAVDSERQLQEVMTDFWFNHFNVFAGKMNEAALLPEYERALRERALGRFGDLLEAVARSPAMLIYLDNWRSSAPGAPAYRRRMARELAPEGAQGSPPPKRPQRGLNENYARELLELHTLGVEGGYTQDDVVQVARCFTGWTVAEPQRDPRFIFRPQMHDAGRKTVLGRVIAEGQGEEDGRQVLDLLAHHPSTARFIARKLARRFVSDDPPEALVARLAATFSRTDGDIRSVLRTLFESPEFWSRRSLRAKVRSPLELVAGSARALGARVDDPLTLAKATARIGEPLFAAQPPTGYVDAAQTWLASGALIARIDFALALAQGQLAGVEVDLGSIGGRSPEEVLARAARRLGAPPLSEKTRQYIVEQLREAEPPAVPARAVGLLLGAPELQRR